MNADVPGASPATGSHRVRADQNRNRAAEEPCNVAGKVIRRQLGPRSAFGSRGQRSTDAALAYQGMQLQREYDCYDPRQPTILSPQMRRSKVTEIVAAHGMLFVLCHSGSCTAFCRVSGRRLCNLHVAQDEVIRSLFWNKHRRCLISVSVHAADEYSSLTSRSMTAECLLQGRPQDGTTVFGRLDYPSFIEFDDVNSKVLAYNAATKLYTVFGLENYQLLYIIAAEGAQCSVTADSGRTGSAGSVTASHAAAGRVAGHGSGGDTSQSGSPAAASASAASGGPTADSGSIVQDVKISPGMLLLIMEREVADDGSEWVPLRVHNIADGSLLKEVRHPLVPGRKPEFIELFNQALVVKQEGRPLHIMDLLSTSVDTVAVPYFPTPAAFIFLYERNCFLSLLQHSVGVWDFEGRQVTRFDDHSLLRPSSHTSTVYINHAQDLIVSLCLPSDAAAAGDETEHGCHGSIHVSSLLSGRCIARLVAPSAPDIDAERVTAAALSDMTALFLDEEHHEIYTGTAAGLVHRWSR